MKKNIYSISLAVIVLMVFGGMAALAQSRTQPRYVDPAASAQAGKKQQERVNHDLLTRDMSAMTNEPHQVLAMAFMQNLATFAKTLSDQAQDETPLSADFARAAVSEIRRNFDEANTHYQEHVKAMRPGRPSRGSAMTDLNLRDSPLKAAIDALDKDVQNYTLDSQQIVTDCADVLKRLDEIAKLHKQK